MDFGRSSHNYSKLFFNMNYRQSLSRELANLQLASPSTSSPTVSRSSRRSHLPEAAEKSANHHKTNEYRRSVGGSSNNSSSSRPILKPRRRGGRSIDGAGFGSRQQDDSDTENIRVEADASTSHQQQQHQQLVPAYKLAEVEKKCEDLTNKLKVTYF